VLEALGLTPTGTREEIAESAVVGADLPGGWYLVVANRSGHALMRDPMLARLSVGGEAVTCDVEEHVMVSIATGWREGRRIWWVGHDGQRDGAHLEAQGELPPAFAEIRDRSRAEQRTADAQQEGVDFIFEIPVQLAKSLTGYRHDEVTSWAEGEPFEVLSERASTSWLGRLLGR